MTAKRWAGLFPAMVLALALGACAGEDGATTAQAAPTVTTTATVTSTVTETVTATPSATASVRGFVDAGAGEPTASAEPTPKATPKPKPKPKPAPAPVNVYYENCDAVRAAGADPIHVGDPGYSRDLDRDGDGVACE